MPSNGQARTPATFEELFLNLAAAARRYFEVSDRPIDPMTGSWHHQEAYYAAEDELRALAGASPRTDNVDEFPIQAR